MKHRVSAVALAVQAFSLSLLTACGSGSPNHTSTPPVAVEDHVPTITLSAPKTAPVSLPFPIIWSTGLATGCTTDFDATTATAATVQVTESAPLRDKTYTVSCTGAGGTTTKAETVTLIAPEAEGWWDGSIDDNADSHGDRNMSGIVTREGAAWLLYYNASGQPAGFYAGTGTIADDDQDGSGDFKTTPGAWRQFSFDGGDAVAQGTLNSGYAHDGAAPGAYSATSSLTGSFSGGSCDNCFYVSVSGARSYVGNGPMNFTAEGMYYYLTNAGSWAGAIDFPDFGLTQTITSQNFTMNAATGSGVLQQYVAANCNDGIGGALCGPMAPVWAGALKNGSTAVDQFGTATKPPANSVAFVPADGGHTVWSFWVDDPASGSTDPDTGDPIHYWTRYNLNVTFTLPPPLPAMAAATFDSTYNVKYGDAPSLATLAGDYTGLSGLNNATAGASTFVVSDKGVVTGVAGACTYTASAAVHGGGGNLYDVLTLTFSGGACIYAGSGTFAGIARYDSDTKEVVVMATNKAHTQGFMFVGTKP